MGTASTPTSPAADLIRRRFDESATLARALQQDEYVWAVLEIAQLVGDALSQGHKLLVCGNGGSAADATHLAAEFVGRFKLERAPLPALSLSDNVSVVTAIGNDYDFAQSFSRQVTALGRENDVLLALSTSGRSPNVLAAVDAGQEAGLRTVGFTGNGGGQLAERVDVCLRVPAQDTARVQEGYMLAGHTLCELVEASLPALP